MLHVAWASVKKESRMPISAMGIQNLEVMEVKRDAV